MVFALPVGKPSFMTEELLTPLRASLCGMLYNLGASGVSKLDLISVEIKGRNDIPTTN